MNRSKILLSLSLLPYCLFAHPFASWHSRQEGGVQQGFTLNRIQETESVGYVGIGTSGKLGCFDIDWGLRAEGDRVARSSRLEILSGTLATRRGAFQLRMGWQKIAWGETFGFYIADLVNPRDYRNPWLNDIDWMRLAVPAIQLKWLGDVFSIEAVITPFPRRPLLPNQNQLELTRDFVIPIEGYPKYPHERTLQAMEGGARIGYLSSMGTDFSFLVYRHWNRNLAYEMSQSFGYFNLTPVVHRTTSLGLCASHAFDAFVVRMDSVYHVKQPWASSTYGQITRQDVCESVLGGDYAFESGASVALQAHHDQWPSGNRQAASLRFATRQEAQGLQLELFGYAGIGCNRDLWIQPRLTWNIDQKWQLKFDLNFLQGKADLWKPKSGTITQSDRTALLWLSVKI